MTANDPSSSVYDVTVEESEKKFWDKIKAEPFVPIGIIGTLGVVGYNLMNIRNRKWPLSVHLIHTRVMAQAVVVGAMTLGVTYHLVKDNFFDKDSKAAKKQ